MACILLMLDIDKSQFDGQRLRLCLEALPGIRDWLKSGLFCQFDFDGDTTTVYLHDSMDCISIEGMGPASLEVARELQRCYGEEIMQSMMNSASAYRLDTPRRLRTSIQKFKWDSDVRHSSVSQNGPCREEKGEEKGTRVYFEVGNRAD